MWLCLNPSTSVSFFIAFKSLTIELEDVILMLSCEKLQRMNFVEDKYIHLTMPNALANARLVVFPTRYF